MVDEVLDPFPGRAVAAVGVARVGWPPRAPQALPQVVEVGLRDVDRERLGFDHAATPVPTAQLRRYWCTSCTATEPSPTAEATRFTDRARMSPTAKIPGVLVS